MTEQARGTHQIHLADLTVHHLLDLRLAEALDAGVELEVLPPRQQVEEGIKLFWGGENPINVREHIGHFHKVHASFFFSHVRTCGQ